MRIPYRIRPFYYVITLAVGVAVLVGCEKDKLPPIITLIGGEEVTTNLNSSFVEPGYVAEDNKDGDLTDQVVVSGTVNTSQEGSYELNYTVKDKEGHETTVKRTVVVELTAEAYAGDFTVTHNCSFTVPLSANQTIVVKDDSTITIQNFFSLIGGEVDARIDGRDVTVIEKVLGNQFVSYTINGNGTMSADGKKIEITYTILPSIASAETCTATYTRK